jgi:hypothetical protein
LELILERKPENGGNLEIKSADQLEEIFGKELLHPGDLKLFVSGQLNGFLDRVRGSLGADALPQLLKTAFPPPPKGGKKK